MKEANFYKLINIGFSFGMIVSKTARYIYFDIVTVQPYESNSLIAWFLRHYFFYYMLFAWLLIDRENKNKNQNILILLVLTLSMLFELFFSKRIIAIAIVVMWILTLVALLIWPRDAVCLRVASHAGKDN